MDPIAVAGLARLKSTLQALLPAPGAATVRVEVAVVPRRIRPSGLNGYLGHHHDPAGDVVGRSIEAAVQVVVDVDDVTALPSTLELVSTALATVGDPRLRQLGIEALTLESIGTVLLREPAPAARRELVYEVRFDYQQVPEQATGTLDQLVRHTEPVTADWPPTVLLNRAFDLEDPTLFEAIDDPALPAPGAWQWQPTERRIAQTALVEAGPQDSSPEKPSTYFVVREAADRPLDGDFLLQAALRSDAANAGGGIGLVFRWQDPLNFYFFLMDGRGPYQMLGKKVAGAFLAMDTLASSIPAVNTSASYDPTSTYDVRVAARGDVLEVHLDGAPILRARDASLSAGRVGLLARGNDRAFFYRMQWIRI